MDKSLIPTPFEGHTPAKPARIASKAALTALGVAALLGVSLLSAHAQTAGTGLAGIGNVAGQQSKSLESYIQYGCILLGGVTFFLGVTAIRKDDPRERMKCVPEFLVSVFSFGAAFFAQKLAETLGSGSTAGSSAL
jgi:hypothetical protein